jgi:3-hydroxyisobutyrate dehydrogenase-like beta-hydroxyacid dehydrogenase
VKVGLLHPGEMGAAVGAALRVGGAEVLWASEHRSEATRSRAQAEGLTDVGSLDRLAERADVIASVCPPDAALALARSVAATGFSGTFVDLNAVAPATARAIAHEFERAGGRVVDGGIIGGPPRVVGTTRLYLSGAGADAVAAYFAGSPLSAIALDAPVGAASALKMCFAAWTKGTSALLVAIRALAAAEDVDGALLDEWAVSLPDLPARSEGAAQATAAKAWRFVGEMHEIAATFAAAGLPDGFHRAAADVYGRMAGFKDATDAPALATVVAAVIQENG